MTLRHMNIYRAVCDCGCNTTRAAEHLAMTQPAVSLAIKELELYYGIVLFDRIGRRLQLTSAGQRFYQYASRISAQFEDMEREMRNWDTHGILRVGASITIGSQFMPGYVTAFSERCPNTQVLVTIAPADQLEQGLLSNTLDFALSEGISHNPTLCCTAYMDDRLIIIGSPKTGFRPGQVLSQAEFRRQRFLLREPGSGTREIFDRAAANAGFSVTPIWEAMSTTALVNAVISGLGIAVLPFRMVQRPLSRGLIVELRAEGMDFRRSFHIVHHRDKYLTPSARTFMELCVESGQEQPVLEYPGLF